MSEALKVPKQSFGDVAHAVVRGAVGLVPWAGTPAVEILNLVVAPPLEKRRNKFLEQVGTGLRRLQERMEGFDPEKLAENEAFVSVATQAAYSAVRTHQKEKLEALRNAVLNAATTSIDADKQLQFVAWIDRLMPWHLRILAFFNDPQGCADRAGASLPKSSFSSSRGELLAAMYPELRQMNPELLQSFVLELHQLGLLGFNSLAVMMSGSGAYQGGVTPLGEEFLRFISSPIRDSLSVSASTMRGAVTIAQQSPP